MEIETYECEETASEPIEATEEAIRIMEEMGLEGQISLTQTDEETGRGARSPYRQMTKDEQFVYGVLCPESTQLHEYKNSPIPLRVLQVAAHAKSTGLFKRIVVWDRESAAVPDPVLVGEAGEYSWRPELHILARWGEHLDEFPALLNRALKTKRDQVNGICSSALKKLQAIAPNGVAYSDEELIEKGADWKPEIKLD